MDEIKAIKALLAEDRPEAWDALPDIDLYMDQVVSYLPRQSVGGKAPAVTSAMINNYVKDGLLPRACGLNMAKELMMTQRAVKAPEMKELGLCNHVWSISPPSAF